MSSHHLYTNLGFAESITALVIGASGGIGKAWIDYLLESHPNNQVIATYHNTPPQKKERVSYLNVDVTSSDSLKDLVDHINQYTDNSPIQFVIYCVGLLHHSDHNRLPERSLKHITWEGIQATFSVNAFAAMLVMQAILPYLPRRQRSVFVSLSARVGSIEDNRLGGWYSYRASKAAHNMFFKTASIEWGRTHRQGIMLALHPGTVRTALSHSLISKSYSKRVLTASESVSYQADIITQASTHTHGKFLAWDGTEITW